MVEKKSCKIGIVFNSPTELRKSSIDYGKYYKGFKSIGLNCILFARKESVIGFDYPIETVENETEFLHTCLNGIHHFLGNTVLIR